MCLHLGIDGGGTRTRAVLLLPSGEVLGTGEAPSSNFNNLGELEAGKNLRKAAEEAFLKAGIPYRAADKAFLGLAGVKSAEDMARMTFVAESSRLATAGAITVRNDLYNALAGGRDGGPGIALIAGTGSNCLGRDDRGQYFMCGGWGWFMDDGGSAMGLSADALRTAARMADGRKPPTRLLASVMSFYDISDPHSLLSRLYNEKWSPTRIASFAPVVMSLSSDGDAAAEQILQRGAESLAELVLTTVTNLQFSHSPRVVLLGGCVRSGPPYQPMVEKAMLKACPSIVLEDPFGDSLYGAALNSLALTDNTVRPIF